MSGLSAIESGIGNKLKVVLLHPFPFNKHAWNYQLNALGNQAHVIAPDLPGFGESKVLPEGEPSLGAISHTIKKFLEEKQINKAVFGGCSWGGYIIFDIWRRYPSLVSGIILCDTRMEADAPTTIENRRKQIAQLQSNGGDTTFMADAMASFVLGESTHSARDTDKHASEVFSYCRQTILSTPAKTIEYGLNVMIGRPDSTHTLTTINVPTLIIVGAEDKGTPPSAAEAMKEKLHSSTKFAIIPNAGHLSPLEKPEEVNQHIRDFLQEIQVD